MQQLPNGDLWNPPQIETVKDEAGNVIGLECKSRQDTVSAEDLPQVGKMTKDVAAILMADLQRNKK